MIKKNNFRIDHMKMSDIVDKQGFNLAFFIGLLGIALLKHYNCSQWVVSLYPITIMIVYASMIYFWNRLHLNEDQAGDNLYYLGFLFTLVSLAYALYQFDQEGGTAAIIENFGIALSTSIVGLFLRILFNKMRTDTVEVEKKTRVELTQAAARLRSELVTTTETIKNTLIAVQQQTQEIMEENLKKTEELCTRMIENSSNSHEQVIGNASRLQQQSEKLGNAIEGMSDKINNISIPVDLFKDELTPIVNQINDSTQLVSSVIKKDHENSLAISNTIESLNKSTEQLHSELINALNALTDAYNRKTSLNPLNLWRAIKK